VSGTGLGGFVRYRTGGYCPVTDCGTGSGPVRPSGRTGPEHDDDAFYLFLQKQKIVVGCTEVDSFVGPPAHTGARRTGDVDNWARDGPG
jgi:hypothetical protein